MRSGDYDVEPSFVGYAPSRMTGVVVKSDQITFLNLGMKSSTNLSEVLIVQYKVPLIDKDGSVGSGGTVERKDIMKMAGRGGNVASTIGGVRGSRPDDGSFVYIDGVKVRGSQNVPKAALNEVRVNTGGIPANYGDLSGGVTSDGYYPTGSVGLFGSRKRGVLDPINMSDASSEPLTVDYEIKVPYTINSDGLDNAIRIKSIDVPATYVHYAVPKVDPATFLTAELIHWQNLKLLNGTANLYYQGTFIGQSVLDVENTNDTLVISLGRDPEVVVERTSISEQYERKILGNNIKETYAWELAVRNNKNAEINLVLQDQYPLAVQKSVETELLESSGATVDENEGQVLWKTPVKEGEKKTYKVKYSVKYPQNIAIYK